MHPISSRPDRSWIVYASFGFMGVLIVMLPLKAAGATGEDAGLFSGWGAVLMFMALRGWAIARYVTVAGSTFPRFIFTLVLSSAAVGGLWTLLGFGLASLLSDAVPSVWAAMPAAWPRLWLSGSVTFLCVLLLIYALDASDRGEAAARQALEADVASREAELRALRAQVNPHFLFNCLHSISSMTTRDADAARRMCLELADFFRSSLKAGAEQRIALADEIALVTRYLEIERVRFGARLKLEVAENGDLTAVTIPPLLLQPLVENAVRHGIATLIEGGVIKIDAAVANGRADIVVQNPFDPDGRRSGTGVGLANVRDRLEATYRGAASIRAETLDGPGEDTKTFKVSLSLPA